MEITPEEKARTRRDKAKDAISLALAGQWEEAIALNREIVKEYPRDVEAHNRLGKALSELGRYKDAKDAFNQALEISPANGIARKNLQRLAHLNEEVAPPKHSVKVPPQLFIEERGKTTTSSLRKLPPDGSHLRMAPGDAVEFRVSNDGITVESLEGSILGEIEPRLAERLARLIQGGNRYAAAVTSVQEQSLVIMIKEIYQHRSQHGIISFPNKQPVSGFLPYLGAPPLLADIDLEEEEIDIDRPPIIDWDEEGEVTIAAPPSEDDEPHSPSRDDMEEQVNF